MLLLAGGGGAARPAPAAAQASPVAEAALAFPLGLALGPDGALYVSERRGHRVRRVDLERGTVTTVAGTGEPGFSGDGGPARAARLRCPDAVDLAPNGDLYVADRCNERIRRVDARSGVITTVAGTGARGPAPDGPGPAVALTGPFYLRVTSADELLFTDTDAHLVRRLDLRTGALTTLAGSGVGGFAGDGGPALDAALSRPHVVLRARNGDLLIGDSFNQRIRRVDRAAGTIRTVAGNGAAGPAIHGARVLETPFQYFGQILEDERGDLLMTEWGTGRLLRLVAATGRVEALAGTTDPGAASADGLPPTATRLGRLAGLVRDGRGRFLVADAEGGLVRRIDLDRGVVETVVGR